MKNGSAKSRYLDERIQFARMAHLFASFQQTKSATMSKNVTPEQRLSDSKNNSKMSTQHNIRVHATPFLFVTIKLKLPVRQRRLFLNGVFRSKVYHIDP